MVERHGKNGNIATGFVKGFGLKTGAIASTVCHDHHNIACVGVDYADMALAANRLTEIEGGFVVAQGGKVPGNPTLWRIIDEKLYLNITKNVVGFWEADIPGNLQASEKNWVGIEADTASTSTIPQWSSQAPLLK